MIYAHARVPMDAQSLAVELADLKAAGCVRMSQDGLTKTSADPSQLKRMMAALVDRLSCVPTDLQVLARDSQRAVTAHGRAPAKANGMKFGLERKLTAHQRREAAEPAQAGEPQRSVVRSHNSNQSTIAQIPSAGTAYG